MEKSHYSGGILLENTEERMNLKNCWTVLVLSFVVWGFFGRNFQVSDF